MEMTLKEKLAYQFMQNLLNNWETTNHPIIVANIAFDMAEAFIKEAASRKENGD